MEYLSKVLFIISNGLTTPVVILLLYLLVKSFVSALRFYHLYTAHKTWSKQITPILDTLTPENSLSQLAEIISLDSADFSPYVKSISEHSNDPAYCERVIANYEVDMQRKLAQSRNLIKFGPMLGLMGTLIPMGPALVGLASGDIDSMAYNMQMAFATTVIGMLIAAVGVIITQVNQRFYARCLNDLEFIYRTVRKIS